MQASIVIPVWNGASVVSDCLDAIYAHCGDELLEVICLDNASRDDSAILIADRFPQVRLIHQPVNLGFAGGVNAGIEVAQGDISVLLNQDSMVQPGWLAALIQVFEHRPEFGIAGCTIYDPDGTVNHAGAMIRRPDAYGVHLTGIGDGQPRAVEYVTGTAFAIRRQAWDYVGQFDEGYYPAYYEESDYCYRARRKGIETVYVPEARVTHLFSSRDWQVEPTRHTANQHRSRYRFVCKHFDGREVAEFFEAEYAAVEAESYFDQAVGRAMAARDTLRGLADILERCRLDLGESPPSTQRRQLDVGFTQVLRQSLAVARRLIQGELLEPASELNQAWRAANERAQVLRQREHDLLTRIYFKAPADDRPEPTVKRWFRLLVLRPLSFLIGRDYLLLAELNTVHVARMDQMDKMDELYQLSRDQWERRLELLEILTDYDYR
jgi:GT2 family glycosyltransferase